MRNQNQTIYCSSAKLTTVLSFADSIAAHFYPISSRIQKVRVLQLSNSM
jgi:hypothetical protein